MQYGQCPSKKRKLGHRNTERRHMWRHREETYVETQRGDVCGDTERRRTWRHREKTYVETKRRRMWRHREKTCVETQREDSRLQATVRGLRRN